MVDVAGDCGAPPSGFEEFTDFTMVMTGDLEGCWYSRIDTATSIEIMGVFQAYQAVLRDLAGAQSLLEDAALAEMAAEEARALEARQGRVITA